MPKIFELFGHRVDQWDAAARENLAAAHCPFMGAECDGGGNRQQSAITLTPGTPLAEHFPGKSKVQSGVCSIRLDEESSPWIVCPRRLLALRKVDTDHQAFARKHLTASSGLPSGDYRVWSEVKMKQRTVTDADEEKSFDYTFDYVIAGSQPLPIADVAKLLSLTPKKVQRLALANGYTLSQSGGVQQIDDFPAGPLLIVEVMTSSTSGGNKKNRSQIAMAVEDAILAEEHRAPGINYRQVWARMVSQLIVKSQVSLAWGGRTVWVIQDVLAKYISASTALDLSTYAAHIPDEVNVLALGYSEDLTEAAVVPLTKADFFSGPISSGAESGFIDIIKIGAPPEQTDLWRSLFLKAPSSRITIA